MQISAPADPGPLPEKSLERASQEEQKDANFSFVAPSSEELQAHKQIDQNS